MAPDEPIESRVAVLESRVTNVERTETMVLTKLDVTLDQITKERTDMAEERGALRQAKWVIPVLASTIGFLSGILVTLVTAHIL